MTAGDWRKVMKELKAKPLKLKKYKKHNAPRTRSTGLTLKRCGRCGRFGAHISKYHIGLCRHCFREIATKIGFKKYS